MLSALHRRTVRPFFGALGDAFLPQRCAACETPICGVEGGLCAPCRKRLDALTALPYCPQCARTMRPEAMRDGYCVECKDERHWNIAGVVRAGPYVEPLQSLVVGLKYSGLERNAQLLAKPLAAAMRAAPWFSSVDALVPVPMHWLRRLQRPCAHADVLARALVHEFRKGGRRIALLRATRRVRYAPSQTQILVRAQKFDNVHGCFAAARTKWWGSSAGGIAGTTVCIVDNLLVSGATVHEVSKVLRAAGARKIYLAVIARAVAANDFQADADALLGTNIRV